MEPITRMDRGLNSVQGATSPQNNPLPLTGAALRLTPPFYTHTFSQVDPSQHFDDYKILLAYSISVFFPFFVSPFVVPPFLVCQMEYEG